jgi:hypothetical protein
MYPYVNRQAITVLLYRSIYNKDALKANIDIINSITASPISQTSPCGHIYKSNQPMWSPVLSQTCPWGHLYYIKPAHVVPFIKSNLSMCSLGYVFLRFCNS